MTLFRTFTFRFLSAALATSAGAQEWYLESQTVAPPARRFHTVATVAGLTVLFGGVDERAGHVLGDTWTYDNVMWTPVLGGGPGPRQRFAACVDEARSVLVVFGGADANGQPLGDTWQFDGGTWQQVATPGPSPRLGAAMAFDAARARVVLFGGGATGSTPTGETWEFDGATWSQRLPGNAPSPRQGHAMTHDPVRGATILFGGFAAGGSSFNAETWEYDGTDWQQIATPTVPLALPFPALTFFAAHGVAVLTGGAAGNQPIATLAFDGVDWQAGPQAPTALGGRQGHAMAYDALREMVVLFGGARIAIGGAIPFNDTWELSTRATFEAFGAGCGDSDATPTMSAAGTRPQLGSTLTLDVAPAGSLAVVAVGFSDTVFDGQPLPLDLSSIGLPGCDLLTSVDLTFSTLPHGAGAVTAVPIPLRRDLLGLPFFAQAVVLQPSPASSVALSNGGRAAIGN